MSTFDQSFAYVPPVDFILRHLNINRLLIVDDSDICRRMLRKFLLCVDSRFHIDEAESGEVCLTMIRNGNEEGTSSSSVYDVIMMDHVMAELTGPQTVARLKSDALQAKGGDTSYIIGITGLCEDKDIEEFKTAGADIVLSKPVDIRKLVDVLKRVEEFKMKSTIKQN